ncbi:MAG TPA: hypothetical protein VL948_12370 [Verrucomicrobiae bacterium]|jgi:hypothetical protein|nr:hypothetical protein [Verrucomicrobiae bacterium]
MARYLHLVGPDAGALAGLVIAGAEPGAEITVVLLDDVAARPMPAGARVLRLGAGLDYAGLLDLVFASDHVIAW